MSNGYNRSVVQNPALQDSFRFLEAAREDRWRRDSAGTNIRLRWRGLAVRHCLQIVPGERILELGAGSGLFTTHLVSLFKAENPITAAVLNRDLFDEFHRALLPNTQPIFVQNFDQDLEPESFDFIIGFDMLSGELLPDGLNIIYQLLKPGGQLLSFEENGLHPIRAIKKRVAVIKSQFGKRTSAISVSRDDLRRSLTQQGFTSVETLLFDIVPHWIPARFIRLFQSKLLPFEHIPGISSFCHDTCLWATKPGLVTEQRGVKVNLAVHPALFQSVSVVIPCHNEAMNLPKLVGALKQFYDAYIHEILVVNDNSADNTAEVARQLAACDSRIKLVDRKPPNGVGRALQDGFAAATGKYILSMDCDFVRIVPNLRDLFDAIAEGHEGAIGSRFSHESILINYPLPKLVFNRIFHLLIKLFLVPSARDLSNNLKLYRADIFKTLTIEEPHFAANLETGLKPVLAGYDIKEIPMPWINRTTGMGISSFRILRVGPAYCRALLKIILRGSSAIPRAPTKSYLKRPGVSL